MNFYEEKSLEILLREKSLLTSEQREKTEYHGHGSAAGHAGQLTSRKRAYTYGEEYGATEGEGDYDRNRAHEGGTNANLAVFPLLYGSDPRRHRIRRVFNGGKHQSSRFPFYRWTSSIDSEVRHGIR